MDAGFRPWMWAAWSARGRCSAARVRRSRRSRSSWSIIGCWAPRRTWCAVSKGLELWWGFLAGRTRLQDPGVGVLRAFVTWLRTGLVPAVAVIVVRGVGTGRGPRRRRSRRGWRRWCRSIASSMTCTAASGAARHRCACQIGSRPLDAGAPAGRRDRWGSRCRCVARRRASPLALTLVQVERSWRAAPVLSLSGWSGVVASSSVVVDAGGVGVRLGEALCPCTATGMSAGRDTVHRGRARQYPHG